MVTPESIKAGIEAALGERMREEIHALSMRTLAPQEWKTGG